VLLGACDLAPLGYEVEEFFLSGLATRYAVAGSLTSDGVWGATPSGSAPYKTRAVVIRPRDPAAFNGTVLVEWLNVTSGQDVPARPDGGLPGPVQTTASRGRTFHQCHQSGSRGPSLDQPESGPAQTFGRRAAKRAFDWMPLQSLCG
jgi:hypothetical protein